MILTEITFGGTLYYLSMVGYALTHDWLKRIISIDPIQRQLATLYGGYCRLLAGNMTISPAFFSSAVPATELNPVTFKRTTTTEAAAVTLFVGAAQRKQVRRSGVVYKLRGASYDVNLLATTTDYDGNTVILPRAFGEVIHQKPVRVADAGGEPTYHYGYIGGTLAKEITAVADDGGGKARFSCTAHGFTTGQTVTIEMNDFGTTYNASFVITEVVADVNKFDCLTLTYVATDTGHAYRSGYYRVYDDGVPIPGNVTNNGATFSLSATPAGEVTISGTGADTTLSDIMDFFCGASYLNLTYNSTKAESPSPDVSYWANSQRKVLDFLSEMTAYFAHLFYIDVTTLYLVDMDTANGTRTVTEHTVHPTSYSEEDKVSLIKATWQVRERVEETTGKFIKTVDYETSSISAFPYGREMSIEPFETTQSNIATRLGAILTIIHKPIINIPMPIPATIPAPGEQVSYTDAKLNVSTDLVLNVRNLHYDLSDGREKVTLAGEGSATAT